MPTFAIAQVRFGSKGVLRMTFFVPRTVLVQ
jgi:hypothetical protein